MLNDIIVIDNLFDDPDNVVSFAKTLNFYDKNNHPALNNSRGNKVYWNGFRSESLHTVNNDLFVKYNKIILSKLIQKSFSNVDISYKFLGQLFFHYVSSEFTKNVWKISEDITKDNWFHRDENMYYAGVVYLYKNPPPNTGTVLIKDNKEIIIDNVYNRLVMYDANILHAPQDSFGENINDSRLTLTIFYKNLSFYIKNQNEYI